MKELRKDIPGYEGLYQVSNLGRVKSLDRKYYRYAKMRGGHITYGLRVSKGTMLRTQDHFGYLRLQISKFGVARSVLVHRLVYMSFNNMPLDYLGQKSKTLVCHKDDNPKNNRLDNLFLGTQDDNIADMMRKGRAGHKPFDVLTAKCKIDIGIANQIRSDYKITKSIYKTADKFGISYATVSRIKNYVIWDDRKDIIKKYK